MKTPRLLPFCLTLALAAPFALAAEDADALRWRRLLCLIRRERKTIQGT